MVAPTPHKVITLADIYLDTGTLHYSGKTLTFKGTDYVRRIVTAGSLERSIALPAGPLRVSDAQIEIADVDGSLKTLLDTVTPFRRLIDLTPELEEHYADVDPTPPMFTGEILGYDCPIGLVVIQLREITTAWLQRPVQHLITRDNFPNLPDDTASAFASIILGRVYSLNFTNVGKQGAIPCPLVDTTTNDYCVARHECYSVPAVYRKLPMDEFFSLVSSSEYSLVVVNYSIGGVTYPFQMIRFAVQQYDGTKIQCDASGINSRWNFTGGALVYPTEVLNPIDCLVSLIYILLQNETNIVRFDSAEFLDTRVIAADRGYETGMAITGRTNSVEVITSGTLVSRLCEGFNIEFSQTTQGKIKVHLFDFTSESALAIPLDGSIILKDSLHPSKPKEVINHIRYRYHHESGGLPDGVKDKGNKEWAYEYSIRNVTDQEELSDNGSNPKLEKVIDLYPVRIDADAVDVVKRKLNYHTLRSYEAECQVAMWMAGSFTGNNFDLGQCVNITSRWGIGSGGWTTLLARVWGVTTDLSGHELTLRMTVYFPLSGGDLDIEFTSHASHDAQTRKPLFPVIVNGARTITLPKNVDFNSTTPAAPMGMVNVTFQEDVSVTPTKISAYVDTSGDDDTYLEEAIADLEDRATADETDIAELQTHSYFELTGALFGGGPNWTDEWMQILASYLGTAITFDGTATNDLVATVEAIAAFVDSMGGGGCDCSAIDAALASLDSRVTTLESGLAALVASTDAEFAEIDVELAGFGADVAALYACTEC